MLILSLLIVLVLALALMAGAMIERKRPKGKHSARDS